MSNQLNTHYKEHWLVAYDMHYEKQRARLRRELQKMAINQQKSFFEILASEQQMRDIALFANECIDVESDKLLIACTTKTLKTHRFGGYQPLTRNGLIVIK